MAATAAKRKSFSISGEENVAWYSASPEARRGFCKACGSTLFWDGVGRDFISIAAGSLDDSKGLTVACHIFVAEKGGYYEIEDGAAAVPDGTFSVEVPEA